MGSRKNGTFLRRSHGEDLCSLLECCQFSHIHGCELAEVQTAATEQRVDHRLLLANTSSPHTRCCQTPPPISSRIPIMSTNFHKKLSPRITVKLESPSPLEESLHP